MQEVGIEHVWQCEAFYGIWQVDPVMNCPFFCPTPLHPDMRVCILELHCQAECCLTCSHVCAGCCGVNPQQGQAA